MSSIITQNRNRAHAVKQLQRGLKKASHSEEHVEDGVGDVQLLGSIANSLIYIGDILKDINDKFSQKQQENHIEVNQPDMSRLLENTETDNEVLTNGDDIPF